MLLAYFINAGPRLLKFALESCNKDKAIHTRRKALEALFLHSFVTGSTSILATGFQVTNNQNIAKYCYSLYVAISFGILVLIT